MRDITAQLAVSGNAQVLTFNKELSLKRIIFKKNYFYKMLFNIKKDITQKYIIC